MAKSNAQEKFDQCDGLHNNVTALYEAWVDNEDINTLDVIEAIELKLEVIKKEINESTKDV